MIEKIFTIFLTISLVHGSIYPYSARQLLPSVIPYNNYLPPTTATSVPASPLVPRGYTGCAGIACFPFSHPHYQAPAIYQSYNPFNFGYHYSSLAPHYSSFAPQYTSLVPQYQQYPSLTSHYPSLAPQYVYPQPQPVYYPAQQPAFVQHPTSPQQPSIPQQPPQYVTGVTEAIPSNEIQTVTSDFPGNAGSDEDTVAIGAADFGDSFPGSQNGYPNLSAAQDEEELGQAPGQTIHNDPELGTIIEARSAGKPTDKKTNVKKY